MTRRAKFGAKDGLVPTGKTDAMPVTKRDGEKVGRTLARLTMDPQTRNASLAMAFGSNVFGDSLKPDLAESSAALGEEITLALAGELSLASRIYASHAVSLDSLFTEMARRSGVNMGQYPDAAERYMRLALKAQSACRSTLEALARLHQPREQTVKHVHVNQGGQAVVADHFHNQTGAPENGQSIKQSDATGSSGTCHALSRPDTQGHGMPIPCSSRKEAVPNARRD